MLDRAINFLKKFNLYILAFATVAISWLELNKALEIPVYYIYLLICAPILLIVLFDIFPAWYKKKKIDKFINSNIAGTAVHADYFRLQPYEMADYEHFQRVDKAHEKVLRWLLMAQDPWLYLTGLSGSGKTSLLQAFVIPELQKQDYRVLVIRSFANPLKALEQELQRPGVIWKKPPIQYLPLAQLLQEACTYLKNKKLLLIFDQFDEFLILQSESAHQSLKDFLTDFDRTLPANLHFLVVVRTDYLGKLSELVVPERYEFKQSRWFDISPFTLADARQFLQNSGLNLNPTLCEKVLAEAVELEESRGLIRPITLNILGVVLTWFSGGGSLKNVQAGQLIRAYLQEALNEPTGFAPLLVAKMLSDAGTKLPRNEVELQALTTLSKAVVRGCLIHLSGKGLVRELNEGMWEISHDFIARLLTSLVWRWRLRWWKRVLPYLSYFSLALWLVVVAIGYPLYKEWQENQIELQESRIKNTLEHQGVKFSTKTIQLVGSKKQLLTVEIDSKDDEFFEQNLTYLRSLSHLIQALDIKRNDRLTKLPSFDGLKQLQFLKIQDNESLVNISSFKGLDKLIALDIERNDNLKQLPSLEHLAQLQSLNIWANGISALPSLNPLTQLKILKIYEDELKHLPSIDQLQNLLLLTYRAKELTQLPLLENLTQLKYLSISISKATQLPSLNNLADLKKLEIEDNNQIAELPSLNSLIELEELKIYDNKSLKQIPSLAKLTKLRRLSVSSNDSLVELPALDQLQMLEELEIDGNKKLKKLPSLENLKSLIKLELDKVELQLFDIQSIKYLPSLDTIGIYGITDSDKNDFINSVNKLRADFNMTPIRVGGDYIPPPPPAY